LYLGLKAQNSFLLNSYNPTRELLCQNSQLSCADQKSSFPGCLESNEKFTPYFRVTKFQSKALMWETQVNSLVSGYRLRGRTEKCQSTNNKNLSFMRVCGNFSNSRNA